MRPVFLLLFECLSIFCEARRPKNAGALYTHSKNVNIIPDGKGLSKVLKNSGKSGS